MDYTMPRCDGVTATRRIRAAGSKVVIFAVTGNTLEDDATDMLGAG